MHAFLIIGSETDVNLEIQKQNAKRIDFNIQKIADLRELKDFTKLKLTEKTAIILKNFDEATTETQNAFLKELEEPQENLIYVLTATNINNILPTIQSRCGIIEGNNLNFEIGENEKEKIEEFINANEGQKLKIISMITKREDAILFMKNLIIQESKNKIKNYKLLDEANKTLNNLEKNGNVQLQLTNFVANIN